METIKIAHLYYDLLNLYGESGNVKALIRHFEKNNVKVITHFLTVDDDIDFSKYDLFYIGSGNKENFSIAKNDILKRKKELKKAWKEKKFFIATGNGLDLFGKNYYPLEQKKEESLNLLNYSAYEIDFRIVGEAIMKSKELQDEIIGFQNRFSVLKDIKENPLFEVADGTGYVPQCMEEGIQKDNFFGTYLLGPILIRNPHLTELIVQKVLKIKEIKYQKYQDYYETKAYEEYRKNILNNK